MRAPFPAKIHFGNSRTPVPILFAKPYISDKTPDFIDIVCFEYADAPQRFVLQYMFEDVDPVAATKTKTAFLDRIQNADDVVTFDLAGRRVTSVNVVYRKVKANAYTPFATAIEDAKLPVAMFFETDGRTPVEGDGPDQIIALMAQDKYGGGSV